MGILSALFRIIGIKKTPVESRDFILYCSKFKNRFEDARSLFLDGRKWNVERISRQFLHALESLERDIPRLKLGRAERRHLFILTRNIRSATARCIEVAGTEEQKSATKSLERSVRLLFIRSRKYLQTYEREERRRAA